MLRLNINFWIIESNDYFSINDSYRLICKNKSIFYTNQKMVCIIFYYVIDWIFFTYVIINKPIICIVDYSQ